MRVSFAGLKSRRMLVAASLAATVILGTGLILASSADSLSGSEARSLLQRVFGAAFKKNQIQIRSINSAVGGGAIVEAQLETAFRFTRDGRTWKAAEMRLGDRNWESLELIDEGIKREKMRRTVGELERVAEALDAYKKVHGRYVVAEDFMKLLDEIAPRFLGPIVQFDYWGTPLAYHGSEAQYRLSSAGPDRQLGNADDLVAEKGGARAFALPLKETQHGAGR